MPTCTRQTCVKAGIWSIPSLHAKKGRHELKWVSDLFHSDIQNKADMCEKECLSSSMPFAEKARHVLDLCVSDLFHPFTQNKAGMCEKRCLTNSMSLAEKARHVCHGCLIYSILQNRDSGLFLSSLVVQNRPDSGELGLSVLFWGNPRCFLVSALFHTPWEESCLAYSRV